MKIHSIHFASHHQPTSQKGGHSRKAHYAEFPPMAAYDEMAHNLQEHEQYLRQAFNRGSESTGHGNPHGSENEHHKPWWKFW